MPADLPQHAEKVRQRARLERQAKAHQKLAAYLGKEPEPANGCPICRVVLTKKRASHNGSSGAVDG